MNSLFSQEELAQKLREILIETMLKRVKGIVIEGVFAKLLDAFSLGEPIRQRPSILYYIFQIISILEISLILLFNMQKISY